MKGALCRTARVVTEPGDAQVAKEPGTLVIRDTAPPKTGLAVLSVMVPALAGFARAPAKSSQMKKRA
jgi:hypothetical protein